MREMKVAFLVQDDQYERLERIANLYKKQGINITPESEFEHIMITSSKHDINKKLNLYEMKLGLRTDIKIKEEAKIQRRKAITKDDWIPCSKRPPEENGFYITTALNWRFEVVTISLWYNGERWLTDENGEMYEGRPLAWTYMPAPYNSETPLFYMTFEELCKNFNEIIGNKKAKQTEEVLFVCGWELDTINSHITRWTIDNKFPYFNDMDGKVMFSDDGINWYKAIPVVKDNFITVYRGVYF